MTSLPQDIDWHAFLGRPPLPLPTPGALALLRDKSILITGAGGSIGSALATRLAGLRPAQLLLLDASESHLYCLQRDWNEAHHAVPMTPILGSAGDPALLDELFTAHAPHIVFHAAAFKHVPLMEQQPLAAMANNILGTATLLRAAEAHSARVVLLSTDKAVAPASVMGATKRATEQMVLASGGVALRLGNVLASRDSVAEVFARQLMNGGPITVTGPDARRYFVTLDEAVNLLLAAAACSDPPALLAPVLAAPQLIQDLARFIARLLAPHRAIEIAFTGLRPGDRMAEALWKAADYTHPADSAGLVRVEAARLAAARLGTLLDRLRHAVQTRDLPAALAALCLMVPDYTPGPDVSALAQHSAPGVCP